MRFEGLDLNLLVALDTLMDCRSVTEAARRLHLSQPTLSAALGRLREYFDDELLMQVGREMVPTAKGEDLAPAISEMLNIARFRVVHGEKFDASTSRRRFRIVASDYALDVFLLRALSAASSDASGVTFEIMSTGPEGMRQFQKGDIDLMITVPEYVLDDHPCETLFRDEDAVICCAGGRFADGVSERQFRRADFAVAVFGEERRPTISELHFRKTGLALTSSIQVPSFSALPGAVCGTDRLAVMHRRHAEFFRPLYPIACHPLPVSGPVISEVAQWHKLRRADEGIGWLLESMRRECSRMAAR